MDSFRGVISIGEDGGGAGFLGVGKVELSGQPIDAVGDHGSGVGGIPRALRERRGADGGGEPEWIISIHVFGPPVSIAYNSMKACWLSDGWLRLGKGLSNPADGTFDRRTHWYH
jgi:hypothetical protein